MDINVEFGPCPFEKTTTDKRSYDLLLLEDFPAVESDREEIVSGRLYFGQHGSDVRHMPFMLTDQRTPVNDVLLMFLKEWDAPIPKILLFVIAPSKESLTDHHRKLKHLLVKGLMTALNTTDMWLCADGLNRGFSKELNLAFERELSRRQVLLDCKYKTSVSSLPETALIGICSEDALNFRDKLERTRVPTDTDDIERANGKYTVSKHFDYFVFFKDHTKHVKGMQNFILNFAKCLREKLHFERKVGMNPDMYSIRAYETPLISLLFQGEVSDIHLVLQLVKSRFPVVIIEGSGGLADILAFAYHQITCRPEHLIFAEFTEVVLKPLLCQKIAECLPDISKFNISKRVLCEKVFDCFRHFKQQDQVFLTVLTLRDLENESVPLPSHLLRSLFKSKKSEKMTDKEKEDRKDSFQIKNDLFLAMDWNVASTNIFARDPTSKFQIDNETFFRALTKPQREQFVSIFLGQGFELYRFLDSERLIQLFQDSLSQEFFRYVVWEGVLGYGATTELSRLFIDCKLVSLLEELTGIPALINTYELDWFSRSIFDNQTPQQAYRKALAVLVLWGILSYRVNLVKILWKYSEQPIHLALVCSGIISKLATHVSDLSFRNEMEKQSSEFSTMATNLITKAYSTLPVRALDLLRERNPIWCYKPLVEIAAFAKDRRFIASRCCQKHLDNVFMGNLKVRDLPYGDITIPLWLKIIITNFLIFPMYLWIQFDVPENFTNSSVKTSQSSKPRNLKNKSAALNGKGDFKSRQSVSSFKTNSKNLGFWLKLYYLYTAPISKFWVSQVFYFVYLFFFSLAVIWPACGSLYLDFLTCLWTSVIIMDSAYEVIILRKKYTSVPLLYKYTEIIIMSIFLLCYILSRIVWYHSFMSPYKAKVMMCLVLLYFYYRVIVIAFPISTALGPMLSRIKRMALVDFTGFMRVAALIVISNGIVIHATIYPDFPMGKELTRRAFFDAMIAFFLTPADHFGNPDRKCIRLPRHPNKHGFLGVPENVCKVGRYYLPNCPNPGFWPYIFGLQYLLFLKLVLLTLLLALFSDTQMRMSTLGTYIWQYQRYELIVNFSNRLAFPAPLSPISYCLMLAQYMRDFFRPKASHIEGGLLLNENDYLYWKILASEYNEENGTEDEDYESQRTIKVFALMDDLHRQKASMSNLEAKTNKLKVQVRNARKFLRSSLLQISLKERLVARNVPQIFSRISPYPFTRIPRFPVSDNRVSWDRPWKSYDPVAYNMPKKDFLPELRPFVDVDIQTKREVEGEDFQMPVFKWNTSTVSPGGVYMNRKSWITEKGGKAIRYELDGEGLPMNPFGRTGLRGRGAVPRWGPNHYAFVIITRWQETEIASQSNYLEAVLFLPNTDVALPGGYVSTENTYFTIQSLFECDSRWNSEADMISFFESLSKPELKPSASESRSSERTTSAKSIGILDILRRSSLARMKRSVSKEQVIVKREEADEPFISTRIKKGYLDEYTNTDQAWCEAEVWHFHYNEFNRVEDKFKTTMLWLVLTEDVLGKVPPGQAALLYSVAVKMKAILEVV